VQIAFLYGSVTGLVPPVIVIMDTDCNWNQYFNLFRHLLNELIIQAPGFVFITPSAREAGWMFL
jgi:predicted Rossmann-fold nucleotide-binding protein